MSSENLTPEESAELAVDGIVRTDHAVYVESSTNPDDLPVGDWLNIQRLHQQGDENGLLKAAREIRRAAREQAAREAGERIARAIEADRDRDGRLNALIHTGMTKAARIARADRNPNGGNS